MSDGSNPVVMGNSPESKGGRSSFVKVAKIAAAPLAILVILIIVAVIITTINRNQEAFTVNHVGYSKKTVSAMVDFALTYEKDSPAQRNVTSRNIFNMYKTEAAAKAASIIPNAEELKAARAQLSLPVPKTDVQEEYVNVVAFNTALPVTYDRYQSGDDQGYALVFNFSGKILPPPAQEQPVSGYGNQALIKQDQQYAYQQAQKYYTQYKDGKISADNLLKSISNDPKLDFVESTGKFDPTNPNSLSSQVFYPDIYNYIASQTKPGLSGVRTGKVATKLKMGSDGYADGYYYFVQLEKASRIVKNPGQQVASEENKIGAAYYGL